MLLKAGRIEVRDLNDALDSQIAAQNSVTVALVSYQESRLQLLLDIGALNSESQNFWLKDHLAAVNAGKPSTGVQASVSEEAVTPPETLFDTAP
jgi:hypothetical protein